MALNKLISQGTGTRGRSSGKKHIKGISIFNIWRSFGLEENLCVDPFHGVSAQRSEEYFKCFEYAGNFCDRMRLYQGML